jgi:hypothetical protein
MSRSYRKPWVKDSNPDLRKCHARAVRRNAKQVLHEFKKTHFPEWSILFWESYEYEEYWETSPEPEFRHWKSIINQWDICDWRFYDDENPKYHRK